MFIPHIPAICLEVLLEVAFRWEAPGSGPSGALKGILEQRECFPIAPSVLALAEVPPAGATAGPLNSVYWAGTC